MTADRPAADSSWPEPPSCPNCKAPNHLGASACWLCGADLPLTAPAQDASIATPPPAKSSRGVDRRRPARLLWPWARPRITLGTTMIGVGVVAVFLAVGQGRAGVAVGLALFVGPAVGYLIARVRRVARGEEAPSPLERLFGEVSATILTISLAAALLAAVVLVGLQLLPSGTGGP